MVYTDYRPTPLQHFMYPTGADGLFLVVDERGVFREDSFQKAVASLTDQEGSAAAGGAPSGFSAWILGSDADFWIIKFSCRCFYVYPCFVEFRLFSDSTWL